MNLDLFIKLFKLFMKVCLKPLYNKGFTGEKKFIKMLDKAY